VPGWRGLTEKHSTMTGLMGQSEQSAARPAHSKELTLPLDQSFLKLIGHQISSTRLAQLNWERNFKDKPTELKETLIQRYEL
jgi:hypothetical protein